MGEENKVMGKANHDLLNGNMSVQMNIARNALRRYADVAEKTNLTGWQEDRKAADMAEKAYREHEAKQPKA